MGRVDVDGAGVKYQVTRQGPPVVLHGFPDSGRLWRHTIEGKTPRGISSGRFPVNTVTQPVLRPSGAITNIRPRP